MQHSTHTMQHNGIEDIWKLVHLSIAGDIPIIPPALHSHRQHAHHLTMPPPKTTLEIGGTPIQHGGWPQQPTSGAWSATSGRSELVIPVSDQSWVFLPQYFDRKFGRSPE